ncbi:MAG: hypothetical protein OEY04_13790 [Gammaproteobacteria bacterium]|nr:hypothetical protein [Gammaproteobacteria bacterium]
MSSRKIKAERVGLASVSRRLLWLLPLLATSATVAERIAAPLDPALIAPHIFEVALENEKIRVLEVIDRNGETQPLHSHPGRLVVYMAPCAWIVTDSEGKRSMESHKLGDMIWEDPVTHGGKTSTVVQECRSFEIEIKDPP